MIGGVSQMQGEPESTAPTELPDLPGPRRRWWLVAVVGVVVACVLVGGGFAWPGWWRGSPTSPSSTSPCVLLAAADVGRAIGVTGLVTRDVGSSNDPVTGTPVRLCTYAAGGIVRAAISTGAFPADRVPGGAEQLAHNVAATATQTRPAAVAGVAAALWATDLGHTANVALITVRTSGSVLDLLIFVVDQDSNPTQPVVLGLVRAALNR
jgi:hypothetical protein